MQQTLTSVQSAMSPGVQKIPAGLSVQEAARFMKTFNAGGMPVAIDDEIVGFLTDRDIVVRCLAEGRSAAATQVQEVMTPKPLAIYEDQDLDDAVRSMIGSRVRRLIVLDRTGTPKGTISVDELAKATDVGGYAEQVLRELT